MLRWGTSPEQLWDVASTVCTRLTARPPPIASWPTHSQTSRAGSHASPWTGWGGSSHWTRREDGPTTRKSSCPTSARASAGDSEAFSQFHDSELTEYADAALAASFVDQWLAAHPAAIQFDECVGSKVPLFLGGVDGVENLDVTDLDVYWTLTGQLRVAALGHS